MYLQVGAFENPNEADNLKARLALSGIQASAQRTQLPDGRVVHRVRIGPYARPEDMNPMRLKTIAHFFEHYKDLEPGKWVKFIGWGDAEEARRLIREAIERAKTA